MRSCTIINQLWLEPRHAIAVEYRDSYKALSSAIQDIKARETKL